MKLNIKNLFVGMLAASIVTACDLDTNPTTSINAPDAFKTTTDADAVMRGVWYNVFNDNSSLKN